MSNFKSMTAIADQAVSKSNNANLTAGYGKGVIAGHEVLCMTVPVRTNGRCYTQVTWYIDGKRSSKAKVAALQ